MTSRLAGLALALSLLPACVFSRGVTASRIVQRRDVVLDRARDPARDEFLVAPAVHDEQLVLHVEQARACTQRVQRVLTVREEIGGPRHPGAANTGLTLAVVGGSLVVVDVATVRRGGSNEPDGMGGIGLIGLGLLLTTAGAVTFAASSPFHTEVRTREEKRTPKIEQTRCGTEPPIGAIAELELPDGARLAARIDAAGDARFTLPAASFAGDSLRVVVRVDGATVGPLLVSRP